MHLPRDLTLHQDSGKCMLSFFHMSSGFRLKPAALISADRQNSVFLCGFISLFKSQEFCAGAQNTMTGVPTA